MRPILALAAVLTIAGCDLFGSEDTLIVATGRVVLAETSAPVPGVSVSLDTGGRILRFVVATTRTGADGRFRIEYDPGKDDNSPHGLMINDEPYDARYTTNRVTYVRGETRDTGDLVIRLNTTP